MVYCGKPSRGCQNCKTRRIKCDEVRPCCTQCRKSSRTCPGYPDEFDLIFRNETLAVKRRAQRAQAASAGKANNKKSNAKKSTAQKASPATSGSPISPSTPMTPWAGESILFYDPKLAYDSPPSDSRSDSKSDSEDSLTASFSDPVIVTPVLTQGASPDFTDFSPFLDQNGLLQLSPVESGLKSIHILDPVINSSFLWSMAYPKEPTAIGFFIMHHAHRRRHEDSQRGFVELLESAYGQTSSTSMLHKATYALSLGALSNSRQSLALRIEARREYGKALKDLSVAIKDPVLATTDETLMTILMFSLYEQITCNYLTKDAWSSHVHGAVTLVKLRGRDQMKQPLSRSIFRAVRSLMFMAAMARGDGIEEFPDSQGWGCDEPYDLNNANRLTLISLKIPTIRARATSLVTRAKTSQNVMDIIATLKKIQEVDDLLEEWVRSLPLAWNGHIKKVVTEEPKNIWSSFFWTGPVYTYQDLNIANVMNDYRIARIFCQTVVIECVSAMPANAQSDIIRQAYTKAVYTAQNMANEIASTLPYLLGFDIENSPEGASESLARATKSTGAYFSAAPAWIILKLSCISEKQRQWFMGRLIYIGKEFGLGGDAAHAA